MGCRYSTIRVAPREAGTRERSGVIGRRHPRRPDKRRALALAPHLVALPGRSAVAWNIVGLLVTALTGAGLVHVLAYHMPLAVPVDPRWAATALDLVIHCPHGRHLSGVAIVALLTLLLVRYELRRLDRLNAALVRCFTARRVPVPAGHEIVPRSPCRLVLLTMVLLGLQVAALGIYDLY